MANGRSGFRVGEKLDPGEIEKLVDALQTERAGADGEEPPEPQADDLDRILDGTLRKPRIAIIGPANSGKSTFINLLFGAGISEVRNMAGVTAAAKIEEHEALGVKLVDTPGFGVSEEHDQAAARAADGADLIVLLFDARNLAGAGRLWSSFRNRKEPVVPVFNKADLLTQKEMAEIDGDLDRWEVPEPRLMTSLVTGWNLVSVLKAMSEHLPLECRPAFVGWLSDELEAAAVLRRQIREEARRRFQDAKDEAERRAARKWEEEQSDAVEKRAEEIAVDSRDEQAEHIIFKYSLMAGGVAITPIPEVDVPVVVVAMYRMLAALAAVYGRSGGVVEILSTFGGVLVGAVGRKIVSSLAKLVPGWGEIVDAAVSFATCYALGKTAKAFFKGEVLPSQFKEYSARMREEARTVAKEQLRAE
jgi:small GTP-binding protein